MFLDYLYQGQNEIGAYQDGKCIECRILGLSRGAEIGAAIAIEFEDKTYAPIHDSCGNVVTLVDADTGKIFESYQYTAFGEPHFDITRNSWLFSSKRYDPETELVYFGRRYYDPVTGCWLTPDPLGYDEGSNLYAFLRNNPLAHFDLYGLETLNNEGNYNPLQWVKRNTIEFAEGAARGTYRGFLHPVDTGTRLASIIGEQHLELDHEYITYRPERSLAYHMGENLGSVTGMAWLGASLIGDAAIQTISYGTNLLGKFVPRLGGFTFAKDTIQGFRGLKVAEELVKEAKVITKVVPKKSGRNRFAPDTRASH